MRKRLHPKLLLGRTHLPGYEDGDGHNGAFGVVAPSGRVLNVVVSDGEGWDHVSVSVALLPNATPTWSEMAFVKSLVFEPDEVVMQLHVADKEHLNLHPGCLHMWRPQDDLIPQPPSWMVAPGALRKAGDMTKEERKPSVAFKLGMESAETGKGWFQRPSWSRRKMLEFSHGYLAGVGELSGPSFLTEEKRRVIAEGRKAPALAYIAVGSIERFLEASRG